MHSAAVPDARAAHTDPQRALDAIESRIVRQREALLAMTRQPSDCGQIESTLAGILEVASRTLNVARVSIWRYDQITTAIRCLDLFDAGQQRHERGMTLEARDYPKYFEALTEAHIIAAHDALSDCRTAEFADNYLKPFGITSMMDVPIQQKNAIIGVLCHEHTGTPRRWTDDEKAFAIGVANLISLALERCDRFRAESALTLKSEALNAAADAMIITDRNGAIVWANPAFTKLSGYSEEEAIGRNPRDLVNAGVHDEAFFRQMWTTLLAGEVWRGEITNRRKDGSIYVEQQTITPIRNDAGGSVSHFVAIKRDLTEQRLLENQFLQAQKMEVVGRLAGGIAHDFNNMLTVIGGTAELVLLELPHDHPMRIDVARIEDASKRASSLTRQLLTFSRKQIAVCKPLVIAALLTEFRGLLQRLIGEDIELEIAAETGNTQIFADPSQIEQVILNLAVNARDAMPRGGKLRIHAGVVGEDASASRPQIALTVADTGTGIPADVLPRIFEPFFTTKEAGKGTGLGLATVCSVVEQLGGTIEVASAGGEGTTFTILLPASGGMAAEVDRESSAQLVRGAGRILLVEDDDSVRQLAERVLERGGYSVMTAMTSEEALEVLRRIDTAIDLLVTDVVLPGNGGRQLAVAAAELRPGLPVLYTSGYTDDTVLAHGVARHEMAFLAKPYTPVDLLAKVRETCVAA
jgi:PAS domain S-box-containing protein